MHRTTVAGDGPTAPDHAAAGTQSVGAAQEVDVRWARAQLGAA
jgi:hypothetical protein